jgi:hypothetical protein
VANVSKSGDRPGYRVKWRTPEGKHCGESGFRTRREALDRKREIESALRKGTYVDPREGGVQFRTVARAWLDGKSDIRCSRAQSAAIPSARTGTRCSGTQPCTGATSARLSLAPSCHAAFAFMT